VLAALTAHYIAMHLAPLWGILLGGIASQIVLFGLFSLLRVLEPQDHVRLRTLIGMLPTTMAVSANAALLLLAGGENASSAPANDWDSEDR
jgi:hypothetical protein